MKKIILFVALITFAFATAKSETTVIGQKSHFTNYTLNVGTHSCTSSIRA